MIIYYTARTSINVMLCRTTYYGWVNDKFGTSIWALAQWISNVHLNFNQPNLFALISLIDPLLIRANKFSPL